MKHALTLAVLLLIVLTAHAQEKPPLPLVTPSANWTMNDYCRQRKVGEQDFYFAAQGNWSFTGKSYEALRSLGLDRLLTPGLISLGLFDPSAVKSEEQKRLVDLYLKNRWPFLTCEYHAQNETARPVSAGAVTAAGDLWMGDGHTEYSYRFDFFLPPLLGEKSTWISDASFRANYTRTHGRSLVEQALPFYKDKSHRWTVSEYSTLGRLQADVTFREIGLSNAIAWDLNNANNTFSYIASQPGNRAVGNKVLTYVSRALCRGAMRQFGGNKSWVMYGPNEPTALLSSHLSTSRVEHENGYPYSHCRIFMYEPYLAGVNYCLNEGFSGTLYCDTENDGHYELSPLGHLVKEVGDFIRRHPERGTQYVPVALLLDWERTLADERFGTLYGTYLPMQDCDQMNYGLLSDLLFPQTPEGGGNSYLRTAPYGDIFDIIKPNVPGKGVDPKALENYRVLFALGGLKIDQDLAGRIMNHVRGGGVFVVNAEDAGALPADFLGMELLQDSFEAKESECALCGRKQAEPRFLCRKMTLAKDAETIVRSGDGSPVAVKHRHGNGAVIVIGARHMIGNEGAMTSGRARNWEKKPLLNFTADFVKHLCSGLLPLEVHVSENDRRHIGYSVFKKGAGWVLTLINYSYETEPVTMVKHATASVDAVNAPKKIPVRIVCRFPVADALEWVEDREVALQRNQETTSIDVALPSGDFKVIEMQPTPIEMKPVKRYLNYALHCPVQTTSETRGHEGPCLVDGNIGRLNGWWSQSPNEARRNARLPAAATVDLRAERVVDHIETLFCSWQRERLWKYTVPWYTQFFVETSLDGQQWETVFDERRNMKPNAGYPLERWFEPKPARYVRLTVTYDSIGRGAMAVEMKVMGQETELHTPPRLPSVPPWEVQYPAWLRDVPSADVLYLTTLKPSQPPVLGWMPPGSTWADLNGTVKLLTSSARDGRDYAQSLYAEAPSDLVYTIPAGFATFAAAAGLGADRPDDAVIFKVLVDGMERYKSPLYQLGQPVLPVVVDVRNAREMRLVVEDPNGKISAYAWWGEARFIKR